MKKTWVLGLVISCLIGLSSMAFGQPLYVAPSAEQTGDVSITTGEGYFHGILIGCASGVTVDVYDNTAASGRKLMPTLYFPGSATNQSHSVDMGSAGVFYNKGIYVDVTTTGTLRYIVYSTPK